MSENRANGKRNGNGAAVGRVGPSRAWLWRRPRSDGESLIPLEARLREIGDRVPSSQIDELWIFPPLPEREFASEFIVLSCFEVPGRRRIVTAHIEADSPGSEEAPATWVQRIHEHGTAPEDWVGGIPDRLLERLSDAGVPRVFRVAGDAARWTEAVARAVGNGAANGAGNAVENAVANGTHASDNDVDSAGRAKVTSRTPVDSGAAPGT